MALTVQKRYLADPICGVFELKAFVVIIIRSADLLSRHFLFTAICQLNKKAFRSFELLKPLK